MLEGTDGQIEIVDAGERRLTINRGGTSTTHREPREDPIGQPGAMAGLVRDFAHGITGNAPQLMNAHEAIESHRWTLAAREQAEAGIETLGDLVGRSEAEMLKYRNFGKQSLREITEILGGMGLHLGMDVEGILAGDAAVDEESEVAVEQS